ncbi:MAG TPA: PAS domain S-box protein [Spirochaetales bacterium]|nr:PAS domain S-box protein [Spirochaetales bacterium]
MKHSKFLKIFICLFFISLGGKLALTQGIPGTQSRYPLFDMLRQHAVPMLLIDPESGAILDANESAVNMYGYPYPILVAMNINQINILSDNEIKAEMQRASENKRNYFNFPNRFADGSVHIMEVFSSPITNPHGSKFLLSIIKEKELTQQTYSEFERYAAQLTGELALRVALYNELKVREKIIIGILVICVVLIVIIGYNFITYKKLSSDFAKQEQKYKNLLMSMQEAYAYHEMVFTSEGKPVDYIFLEANPAFETMTGLRTDSIVGKRVTEIIPGVELEWIIRYGEVATTRKPVHFEQYSTVLKRWYRVSAFSPEPGKFVTIFQDVSETRALIQELNHAVEEKEMLYRELLHRIKNTLLTISALVSLQYTNREMPSQCKPVVSHIYNQIKAYADLYALMHESGTAQSVNGKKYFTSIIETLVDGFLESNMELDFICKLDDVAINYRTASSIGLVINELITNVFKHAFKDRQKGKLTVSGTYTDNVYEIVIADNGAGFPENFSIAACKSFGLQMVEQFITQLHGEITITQNSDVHATDDGSGTGAIITIKFPI